MNDNARVVMVTGGSRGIGEAIVRRCVDAGARVAALSRAGGATAGVIGVAADVSDPAAIAAAVDRVEAGSPPGALVNAAGVGRYAPFVELTVDDWRSMYEINVLGLAAVTGAVLPGMLDRGSGHIINVGSKQAYDTAAKATAYASTKAAVVSLSRCLAAEVGSAGVHVTVLNPGGVLTDFAGIAVDRKSERYLEADEVAAAAVDAMDHPGKSVYREVLLIPGS